MTDGLKSMIQELGNTKDMTMIEIGSYIGESTVLFAEHFKHVLSIDPFLNDYDENDDACKFADFEIVYKKFTENISKHHNITHIRKLSCDAIEHIKDKVDFVYIDGLHTYDQVKKDIANYRKIIKENGVIGGHDYSEGWPDIIKGVDESIGKPDMVFIDCSWIKKL